LEQLRGKVAKVQASALFDTATFARNIESAYRTMWEKWLAGKKPEGFAVKAGA